MTDSAVAKYQPAQIQEMAEAVVKSGLFPGIKTVPQAFTLMMLADAYGIHPMKVGLIFDILPGGKPSMKGEAVLAEFYSRGGKVKWGETTDKVCEATFYSPGVPEGFVSRFTIEDARRAQLAGKNNWLHYAQDMLRWRCVTRGVKATLPAAGLGLYPTEVAQDFKDEPQTVAADAEIMGGVPAANERKGLSTRLIPGEERCEPTTSPDLTPLLEQSIAVAEAKKDAALDARCKECASVTEIYKSTQAAHLGREYRQCKWAHDQIMDDMAQGVPAKDAHAAVSKHTREWVGSPPRKVPATKGAAPEASSGPIPAAKPTEPAPSSMFDPEAIASEVSARLAKEPK